MAKKPSEWTPQEAWTESARAHCRMLRNAGIVIPYWTKILDFPADPVERVSDAFLQAIVDDADTGSNRWLMALELIERRAKDKEQGR